MTVTLDETLMQLEALGNKKMRAQNIKRGAGEDQFGVRRGTLVSWLFNLFAFVYALCMLDRLSQLPIYPVNLRLGGTVISEFRTLIVHCRVKA